MKRITIYLSLIIFYASQVSGQGFSACYGGYGEDFTYSVTRLYGCTYMLSSTASFSTEASAMAILKIDSTGNKQWIKQIEGGTDLLSLTWATVIDNYQGYLYLAGYTNDNTNANRDFILLKMDTSGVVLWSKRWGDNGNDRPYGLTFVGNYVYVFGYETQVTTTAGYNRLVLTKISVTDGSLAWNKLYGNDVNLDFGQSIVALNNKLYVTGATNSFTGSYDGFIMSIDTSGSILWSKIIMSQDVERLYAIDVLNNNTLVAVGETTHNVSSGKGIVVLKFNTAGVLTAKQKISCQYAVNARSLAVLNNHIYLGAWFTSSVTNSYILELDTNLSVVNSKVLGTPGGSDKLRTMAVNENVITYAGNTNASSLTTPSNGGGNNDLYVVNFNNPADIFCDTTTVTLSFASTAYDLSDSIISYTTTDIPFSYVDFTPIITSIGFDQTIHCAYSLPVTIPQKKSKPLNVEIYPNPACSYVYIRSEQSVNMSIYSLDGRLITRINDSRKINVSDLSNGMYLIKIEQGRNIAVKRLIISH